MRKSILNLKGIKKHFEDTDVLKGFNLEVYEGEFITLLGSSGCGKTTTLRIIAGLETPDEGKVFLAGEDVTEKAANKRDVNTVFQNYALFPHMNVYKNIAYGLVIKKVDKKEIKERVTKMLDLVQLSGFEKRMPAEMSGGQRQRVAIARALINNPKVLLLDEPLGALDLQLRRQMQFELKRLQKSLGTTFIYITHDQEEAMNMSDRIIVMRDGIIDQDGSPDDIYYSPLTSYTAKFVGNANVLLGSVSEIFEDYILVKSNEGSFFCKKDNYPLEKNQNVSVAVRGENIEILGTESKIEKKEGNLLGEIIEKSYVGGMLRIVVRLFSDEEIVISRHGFTFPYNLGEKVYISWKPEHGIMVDRRKDEKK
mgnify:FL=1